MYQIRNISISNWEDEILVTRVCNMLPLKLVLIHYTRYGVPPRSPVLLTTLSTISYSALLSTRTGAFSTPTWPLDASGAFPYK